MNLFTEEEYKNQSQHFAFRLRNLYLNDRDVFFQIQDYLPFPIYINERKLLNYNFFSKCFFSKGVEIEKLYETGISYLDEISNPYLLQLSINKAKKFHHKNDFYSACSYLQEISLNKKMTPFFTNKILIDERLTLNTTLFPLELESLEKIFKEIIPWGVDNYYKWQKFQTLTKREKEILKLLANGKSNKEVGNMLFISNHSVHAHRRNIYKKLDINKTSQLVCFAILLDII